jgi:hypothetical protein
LLLLAPLAANPFVPRAPVRDQVRHRLRSDRKDVKQFE